MNDDSKPIADEDTLNTLSCVSKPAEDLKISNEINSSNEETEKEDSSNDVTDVFHENGINNILKQAVEEDKKNNYEEAIKFYKEGIKMLIQFLKHNKNEISDTKRKVIRDKCVEYLDRAEKLKKHLSDKEQDSSVESKPEIRKESIELMERLSDLIESPNNFKWDDIIGLHEAKEALKEYIILPIKFPHIFRSRSLVPKGILLFGPPGSGKSCLARAVANEANCKFLYINSCNLVSRWIGDNERTVSCIFELAKLHAPIIVFIDEIDSIFSNICEVSAGVRRVQIEILFQFQKLEREKENIFLIGSSTRPWDMISSIRRRLDRRVFLPLPEYQARMDMFKLHLRSTPHNLNDEDFKTLGRQSEGYSPSDIILVVREATMKPIRKIQSATHFKKISKPEGEYMLTPCSSDDQDAIEMSFMDAPTDKLLLQDITQNDFLESLSLIKPSVTEQEMKNYKEFIDEYC